jgi:hypothetical protein
MWNIICDIDEETKADYKQFQQLTNKTEVINLKSRP